MASLEAENHIGAAFRVCLKMNTNLFTQVKGVKTSSDMIEKPAAAEKCVCQCKESPNLQIEILCNQARVRRKTNLCFGYRVSRLYIFIGGLL